MINQPQCNLCHKRIKIVLTYNYPFYMRPTEEEIKILPLKIGFCQSCDHLTQIDPPTEKLKEVYNKFYQTYCSISQEQIKDFADFVGEGEGSLLEIGCSDGQFLNLIKGWKVYGCDPSPLVKPSATIKREFFSKDLFDIKFDCIVARHVLEHIEILDEFIQDIRSSLKGRLAIEVPNIRQVLANGSIGGFSHEHINYFTLRSLNNYLNGQGFRTISTREHKTRIYWLGEIADTTESLVERYLKKIEQLKIKLAEIKEVYVYGGGRAYFVLA